ncbi:cation diffusion facilitator family transporter [Actinoplanes rectilineatus]|uniref:cation diffusion facilitator family transporter n=1 Tax=Actinoplanes rectilineatus TaxID=113571 RepID=UPI0009F84FAA|nr:cation diffusion facilitator family transporter [Actinoplanes rectilineatus]
MNDSSHGHDHGDGLGHRLRHLVTPHSHDSADKVDTALEASDEGMRALWISLAVLGVTAAAQALIVALSGSVALLGDTVHNVADALTAVPLGVAFWLGRRAATRAYTYGFGRAEDLAGVVIVLVIAASALASAWFAVDRLLNPQTMTHLPWVFAAGLIGFAGNELVARYRIRVGRRIGSAALVADGLHARTDGFTSLAVVLAAAGAWLGWTWADPVIGLLITAAITLVLKDAAREVHHRLMDRVDPALVDRAEAALRAVPGIRDVADLRLRWIGHRLHAEAGIVVDADLSLLAAHALAAEAEHRLTHDIPRLLSATVHVDPSTHPGPTHHAALAHTDPAHTSPAPAGHHAHHHADSTPTGHHAHTH